MYSVEGELTVRKDPESLIGMHGLLHIKKDLYLDDYGTVHEEHDRISVLGSERLVSFAARRLHKRGTIPVDTEVEHITSLEQAERYAGPTTRKIAVARYRMPNLTATLNGQVPDGAILLEGNARLWKEHRFPTPYIYFAGLGKLLAEVEYTPVAGWYNTCDEMSGSRRVLGLVTPIGHIATTTTKTESRNYRTW